MIDENVAGASVSMATEVFTKSTDVLFELIRLSIERNARLSKERAKVLSGGEVTYQKLKAGGEVTMISSFAREDYDKLVRGAKKLDIPVAALQEKGKEKTVSLFFNLKDREAINAIIQDIMKRKTEDKSHSEKMRILKKDQAEALQETCSRMDIPLTLMNSHEGIKCIYSEEYEKEIDNAVREIREKKKYTDLSAEDQERKTDEAYKKERKDTKFRKYHIERDGRDTFTVKGGSKEIRMSLDDASSSCEKLMESFGMSETKARKIIEKAGRQSVTDNLLRKGRNHGHASGFTIRHKKQERGARK